MHEIRHIMEEGKIRGVVVEEEERLRGIVVLWDLKKLKQNKQWNSPVKAFMNRKVATISPGGPGRRGGGPDGAQEHRPSARWSRGKR